VTLSEMTDLRHLCLLVCIIQIWKLLPDHDLAPSECDESYANQHYTDPTMERTEFSFQAAVEEIYRVLPTSECPPPPSATQDYKVRASVDLDGEAETPSFRILPQSAKNLRN